MLASSRNQRGVGLLEVMIFSALLAVFATVVLSLSSLSERSMKRASYLTTIDVLRQNLQVVLTRDRCGLEKSVVVTHFGNTSSADLGCIQYTMLGIQDKTDTSLNPGSTLVPNALGTTDPTLLCPDPGITHERLPTFDNVPNSPTPGRALEPFTVATPGGSGTLAETLNPDSGYDLSGYPTIGAQRSIRWEVGWGYKCNPAQISAGRCVCPTLIFSARVIYFPTPGGEGLVQNQQRGIERIEVPLDPWCSTKGTVSYCNLPDVLPPPPSTSVMPSTSMPSTSL